MKCLKEVDLISFQYPIETQSNFQRNINLWIPALCAPAFAFVCNTHKKEEEEANLTCRTPCHATAYASNQRIDLPWFIQAKQSHLPTANKGIYQSRPDPLRPTAADKQQRRESKKKKNHENNRFVWIEQTLTIRCTIYIYICEMVWYASTVVHV